MYASFGWWKKGIGLGQGQDEEMNSSITMVVVGGANVWALSKREQAIKAIPPPLMCTNRSFVSTCNAFGIWDAKSLPDWYEHRPFHESPYNDRKEGGRSFNNFWNLWLFYPVFTTLPLFVLYCRLMLRWRTILLNLTWVGISENSLNTSQGAVIRYYSLGTLREGNWVLGRIREITGFLICVNKKFVPPLSIGISNSCWLGIVGYRC